MGFWRERTEPVYIAGVETPLEWVCLQQMAHQDRHPFLEEPFPVEERPYFVRCPGCGWTTRHPKKESMKFHLEHCEELDW